MTVKMQIRTAGIAIAKSNDIDLALVFNPDLFNCAKKKTEASYKGTLLKPGKMMCLLCSCINFTGAEV